MAVLIVVFVSYIRGLYKLLKCTYLIIRASYMVPVKILDRLLNIAYYHYVIKPGNTHLENHKEVV
jgi:hypothetical protein